MLTFSQRIKILPIKIILYCMWAVDSIGNLPDVIITNTARAGTVVVLVSFFLTGTATNNFSLYVQEQMSYIPRGIIWSLYGTQHVPGMYATDVLGAKKVKDEFPIKVGEVVNPVITAKSALVADVGNNKFIYQFQDESLMAPASTTKLMTAMVAIDLYGLDETLTTPAFCTTVESSRAGLVEDEKVAARELIKSLLIASAGDSACVLATGKMSYTDFVNLMNDKARALGMDNTYFTNPVGLDGIDGSHYSTAQDLYKLSKSAMRNEFINEIVSTKDFMFGTVKLYNTNKLLWEIPHTVGVKTGTTTEAGQVLIYEYRDDDKDLMIIVMGSEDRFEDTAKLLEWANKSFTWTR